MAQQNIHPGIVMSGSGGGDKLQNWGANVTIDGGSGGDEIYNEGANVVINGGADNDTVYNNGSNVLIYVVSGDNFVNNQRGSGTTVIGGSGRDTLVNNADNALINGGAGENFIQHQAGSNVTLAGGAGFDKIMNLVAGTIVLGGAGNADITNSADAINSTLFTGEGCDTVSLFSTGTTVVNIGAGENLIRVCADSRLIVNAVDGARIDYEYFNGASASATLTSLDGRNTLRATRGDNLFQHVGGETTFVGFSGNDTLSIVNNGVQRASIDGEDVVLSIVNGGSVRLKNAKGRMVRITDNRGPRVKTIGGHYTYSPQDVIKKFMSSLDRTRARGEAAVDEAIRACSNFDGASALIHQMIADINRASSARSFLADKCGLDLDNDDTGAITGWDAGGARVKTASTIVHESTELENFAGNSFVVEGLTVKLNEDFQSLAPNRQQIVRGLKTWWTSEPLKLIAESYGENFSFGANSSATVRELDVEFLSRPNNANLALIKSSSLNGRTVKLTLQINMAYYNEINDADGRSSRKGTSYLDRVLAHEFTHAVMAANIDHFGDLPAYVKEGTAELTHGIDDERQLDLVKMVEQPSTLMQALSPTINATEVSFAGLNAPSYAAGFIFFRYLAKQAAIFVEG